MGNINSVRYNRARFGDDFTTNYVDFGAGGLVTYAGAALRSLNLRPGIIQKASKLLGKPTEVYRGANVGYSMPIWDAGANADEELYFRMRIPVRWNGATDPQVGICMCLSAAETVGDYFKFQLSWQVSGAGAVMGETVSSVVSEQRVLTGREDAYDVYFVFFNIDWDDATNPLVAGNMLQARLRRVDATDPDVSNEIMVWDWTSIWPVSRDYGTWSVNVNAT